MSNNLGSFKFKIFGFLLNFFIMQSSDAQVGHCKIKGKISNQNFKDIVYLLKGNKPFLNLADMEIVDSSAIDKGIFSFHIPLSYTDYYSVRLKSFKKGFILICSPGEKIELQCDTSNFKYPEITGSKENTLRKNSIDVRDSLIVKMNSYVDSSTYALKCNDSSKSKKYDSLNIFWANEITKFNIRFIRNNPHCLTSLEMYNKYFRLFDEDSVKQYLKNLPIGLRKHSLVKEISYKKFILETELKTITKFYEIKYFDTLNQLHSFNPYSGKLVLIDFWASWCKPCIENFPLLKTIEEKYKDKNFAIIGISLDVSLKRWKNEINRSGLTWKNISDLKGEYGLGAKYLNVTTIPRYVLIGKDGFIINDDVRENEIEKMIIPNL